MLRPSLHSAHFRSGCSVQGDSSEQGEPDRNNTINQTRLSLKRLFPLGRRFASQGHRLTSGTPVKKRMSDPCVSPGQVCVLRTVRKQPSDLSFQAGRLGKTRWSHLTCDRKIRNELEIGHYAADACPKRCFAV